MRVLGLGDNIIDRFVDRQVDYPGGNAVNVAVFSRRHGAEAAYLGVFGDDPLGGYLRRTLEAEGISTWGCQVKQGSTGVSRLHVVDGDRTFLGWNGGGVTVTDPLILDEELLDYIAGFDLVHSSVYSRIETQLPALARTGALISFDYSSEEEFRSDEYLGATAPHIDLALVSCGSLSLEESKELLLRIAHAGAALVVGTRGESGSLLLSQGRFFSHPAHLHADLSLLVDTMGCGDAFLAATAVSLASQGWERGHAPEPSAIEAALACGAEAAKFQCTVEAAFAHPRCWSAESQAVR